MTHRFENIHKGEAMNNLSSRRLTSKSVASIALEAGYFPRKNGEFDEQSGNYWFVNSNFDLLFADTPECSLLLVNVNDLSEVELFQELRTAITLEEWVVKYGK